MKKNVREVIAGVGIIAFLIVAVLVYCQSAGVFRKGIGKTNGTGQEETTAHLIQPREKTREELMGKSDYQVGDCVVVEGLVWNISDARIVRGYENLDAYYRKKEIFTDYKTLSEVYLYRKEFSQEETYLVLQYSVTNENETVKRIQPGLLTLYNKYGEGDFRENLTSYNSAGRSLDGTELIDKYAVNAVPGESYEFEWVWELGEYYGPIYDLYVSFEWADGTGQNLWGNLMEQKVCLGIAPKHLGINDTDIENCYLEMRDIPAMKRGQWTNLEMSAYQKKGIKAVIAEADCEFGTDVVTRVIGSEVVSWEAMPEEYKMQGTLEKMADCYEEKHGISRERLKILLVDTEVTDKQITENVFDYKVGTDAGSIYDFYANSYIFTMNDKGEAYAFGTADDWMIISNTASGNRTGHINIEKTMAGDRITMQMAYLLPLEIYEAVEALYFSCGDFENDIEDISVVKLPLN